MNLAIFSPLIACAIIALVVMCLVARDIIRGAIEDRAETDANIRLFYASAGLTPPAERETLRRRLFRLAGRAAAYVRRMFVKQPPGRHSIGHATVDVETYNRRAAFERVFSATGLMPRIEA